MLPPTADPSSRPRGRTPRRSRRLLAGPDREVLRRRRLRAWYHARWLAWVASVLDAWAAMPDEDRDALNAWLEERPPTGPSGYFTWPGWARHVGPEPIAPRREDGRP